MRRVHLLAAISLVSLLTACNTVQFGREFNPATFESRVERGVTTREVVRSWLGEPSARGVAVNEQGVRYEEWNYYYGHGKLSSMQDAQLRFLQVRFDTQGRVASYSWTGDPRK